MPNENFYGFRTVDEAFFRNQEMIKAVELAATIIGGQPYQTINDEDKKMYIALKNYAESLQSRFE